MGMTLKLAWRNIWRNRRRSLLVLAAIVSGLWAMVYMIAIMAGMNKEMVETAIENGVGHIQVHKKGFHGNMSVLLCIRDPIYFNKKIENDPRVAGISERIKAGGLVSSAASSSGVMIWGIDPENEPRVSAVTTYLREGEFLTGTHGEIYIGRALAEKLKVALDDKIVIMAQGLAPDIGTAAFRIKGIFESTSSEYDKYNVFISIEDAQDLLFMGNRVSEIVIVSTDMENVDGLALSFREELEISGLEVPTWEEIIPMIVQMIELFRAFNWIIFIIVIIAMAFGIVNTMLMSVFERKREIGILMAIGTKPKRIFTMIMCEGFFLGLLGIGVGWVIILLTYAIVGRTGIDLSIWAQSMKYMGGIGSTLFPLIDFSNILWSTVSVFVASFVSSLYPAVKVMRLSPVKAFKSV